MTGEMGAPNSPQRRLQAARYAALTGWLGTPEDRNHRIARSFLGLDGSPQSTLDEEARREGVSRSRVRQIVRESFCLMFLEQDTAGPSRGPGPETPLHCSGWHEPPFDPLSLEGRKAYLGALLASARDRSL